MQTKLSDAENLSTENLSNLQELVSIDYKMEDEIADDSFYLFSCAQLTSREAEFLDRGKFERMASAKTLEELKKILGETYYSNFFNLIDKENNLNNLIFKFNQDTTKYLLENLKEEHLATIELLMLEEFVHNYKIILKSLILNKNFSNLFILLTYTYDTLLKEVTNENISLQQVDQTTKFILNKILSLYNDFINYSKNTNSKQSGLSSKSTSTESFTLNLKAIEINFEKFYIEDLFNRILKIKSKFLIDYLRHFIDIFNIKNLIRIKYLNLKIEFDDFLINNGFLPYSFFKKFKDTSKEKIEDLVVELSNTCYFRIVEHGIRNLNARNSFFSFEKNEYIFYLKFLKNTQYTVANLEKIFSFFMRKKIELKILNMVYLGILYKIDKGKLLHKIEIIE